MQKPLKDAEPLPPPIPLNGPPVIGPPMVGPVPPVLPEIAFVAPPPTSLAGILASAFGHCDGCGLARPALLARLTQTLTGKQDGAAAVPQAAPPAQAPPQPPLKKPVAPPEPLPAPMPTPPPRPNGNTAQHIIMPPAQEFAGPRRPAVPAVMPLATDPAPPRRLPAPAAQLLGPIPNADAHP